MSLSDPANVLSLVLAIATAVPAMWAGTYLGKSYREAKARFTLVLSIAIAAILAYAISEIVTLATHQSYTPTMGDMGRSAVVLIQGWALFYVISR